MPEELNELLEKGKIILDPIPPEDWWDGDTVDVSFGNKVELPAGMPLEIAEINGKRVMRRLTIDFRNEHSAWTLNQSRSVEEVENRTRIRFILGQNETLEIQPGMLVLAYTRELVCVPYDLQMRIEGRSRIARCGLSAHISSPVFHPGWCGYPGMEIENSGSLSFNAYPGEPFACLMFNQLSQPAKRHYWEKKHARYSGQH